MDVDQRAALHARLDALIDACPPSALPPGAADAAAAFDAVVGYAPPSSEPMLRPNPDQYVLHPIKYPAVFELYKKAVASFWVVEEIDMKYDYDDWCKLKDGERHFIKHVLAFFAASDFLVNCNLVERFMKETTVPEVNLFYGMQCCIEGIHSETYALLLENLIRDPAERYEALHATQNFPAIRKKAEWAQKWTHDRASSYAKRLVCFCIVEGVHFSGSFCALYWLRKRNLLKGVTHSNTLISRDESLHTEFGVLMYSLLEEKLSDAEVHEVVREAVDIEKEFVCDALPCALIGMNAASMSTYIEFVADRLLAQLGHPKLYGSSNPFDFMDMISVPSKSNFFEGKEQYSLAMVGDAGKTDGFGMADDF